MYFLNLPSNWSWFVQAPHQIEISRDQGRCACCWAIAVASCLGDRFAIKYNIKSPKPSILSAVLLCQQNKNMCGNKNGCYGGNSIKLVNMLITGYYLGLEKCLNFEKTLNQITDEKNDISYKKKVFSYDLNTVNNLCRKDLIKNIKFQIEKANWLKVIDINSMKKGFYTRKEIRDTICQMKKSIIEEGPIIGEFIVSDKLAKIFNYQFNSYENMPVYSRPIDEDIEKTENHVAVITGWGKAYNQEDILVPYWEIRNSFGYDKNFYGIFKIEMTTYERQKYSFGIDVPLYNTISGKFITPPPIILKPKSIENLEELIENKIFERI